MQWLKFLICLKNILPKNQISQSQNERINSIINISKLHSNSKKKSKLISICIKEIIQLLSISQNYYKHLDFDENIYFFKEINNLIINMINKTNKIIENSKNEEQKHFFTLIKTFFKKIQHELYNSISQQFLNKNDIKRYTILHQYYLTLNQNARTT